MYLLTYLRTYLLTYLRTYLLSYFLTYTSLLIDFLFILAKGHWKVPTTEPLAPRSDDNQHCMTAWVCVAGGGPLMTWLGEIGQISLN